MAFMGRINRSEHFGGFVLCFSVCWYGQPNPHGAEGLSFGLTLLFAMFILFNHRFGIVFGNPELSKGGYWICKDLQ